jgi:acyl carrier protein
METVRNEIREFIVENFLFGRSDHPLADDESFLDAGIVDSTGILELVAYLEQRYEIGIADHEVVPTNLDSVDQVVRFVESKRVGTRN